MAKRVIKGSLIKLGGSDTDFSDEVSGATLEIEGELKDVTNFASGDWDEEIVGTFKGKLTIEAFHDSAQNKIQDFFWTNLGVAVAFKLREQNAAIGTTNREFRGSINVNKVVAGGKVKDVFGGSYNFNTTGTITRHTS